MANSTLSSLPNGFSSTNTNTSTGTSSPLSSSKTPSSTGTSTPKLTNFSLTENTTNISPAPGTPQARPQYIVPEQFLLPNGYPDYLKLILTSRVYEVVNETPLTHAVNLSNRLECGVLLKREDLQPVFSFKLRGAYNKMAHLADSQRWKGVVACSAGNHAQGVAFSARKLKIPATIVMPQGTPAIKHRNVSRLGGSVILRGADFDAAKEEAHRLEVLHGLTNIPPFDDPYVIAGQGTIGMELLRQTNLADLEAVFCCVGGGGLIAGIGVYIKRIAPHVKIIGVETCDANAMVSSLAAGKRVPLKDVGLFADGKAVKLVGEETFRLCSEVIDQIIQVDTDQICAAIKDVFEDTRSILEPAGALSLAGLKRYVAENPSSETNRNLVALCSGANMDFDRLRFVAERAALGERKEALLAVTIPEKPGSFVTLVKAVHPYNVTEFSYRYHKPSAAHVILGVAVPPAKLPILIAKLKAQDMPTTDLSSNELAKSHIRYLIGGRLPVTSTPPTSSPPSELKTDTTPTATHTAEQGQPEPLQPSQHTNNPPNDPAPPNDITPTATPKPESQPLKQERLFRFEFPERIGALHRFLTALTPGFNISLWHYRNYGGDQAKILAGIQVPRGAEAELAGFLERVGYPWTEETSNECYRMFLRDEDGE